MNAKLLTLLLLPALSFTAVAQDMDTIAAEPITTVPVSHWSLSLKGGCNSFTMMPMVTQESDKYHLTVSGSVDYDVNPFLGLGLDYAYNDYSRPYMESSTVGSLNGSTNDFLLRCSANLSNMLSPYRSGFWRRLNLFANAGSGVSFYSATLDHDSQKMSDGSPCLVTEIGLTAEFSIGKTLALVIDGSHSQYDSRTMGVTCSATNCTNNGLLIGLRFHLPSDALPAVRTLSLCSCIHRPVPVVVQNKYIKEDSPKTIEQIQSLTQENTLLEGRLKALEEEADSLKKKAAEALQQKNAERLRMDQVKLEQARQDSILQEKFRRMEADLQAMADKKIETVSLVLENIEFKTGSSILSPKSYSSLDHIASILTEFNTWSQLKISGHTDNVGADAANLKLSRSRALSVRKHLISKGLPGNKIVSTGYGETKPVAPNTTPQGKQKNRRVEFEVN
jgi:outer membrane protein OmpA-like peptidoglycan-associated protein